jgi:GNAT superfamily N-acetyltransferase
MSEQTASEQTASEQAMRVVIGEDFEPHLENMITLDREVLPEVYVTSEEKLRDRFEANPHSFVALISEPAPSQESEQSGELLGYVNLFPITEEAKRELLAGDLPNDIEMTGEHVNAWSEESPTDLYVITVAVSPHVQGGQVTKRLVQELKRFLRTQRDEGFRVGRVYTSVVTGAGERFMGRLGFKPTSTPGGCWVASGTELMKGG